MAPLMCPEYIHIKLSDIPEEIIQKYNVPDKANKIGMINMSVVKGMYGLPQSSLLVNERLKKRLNKHSYLQSKYFPGLWYHRTRLITFCLTVDDFGIKYIGCEHAEHLLHMPSYDYKVTADWTGTQYTGLHMHLVCIKHQVHLFIPGYVKKALTIFSHKTSKCKNQPFPHTQIKYGSTKQFAKCPQKPHPLIKLVKNHKESLWKIPLPWQRHRHHTSSINRCHGCPIFQPHQIHSCSNMKTS